MRGMHAMQRSCFSHESQAPDLRLPVHSNGAMCRMRAFKAAACSGPMARKRAAQMLASRSVEMKVDVEEGLAPLVKSWDVPDGSELYNASMRKPLGLVLAATDHKHSCAAAAEQGSKIIVEKVTPNGKGEIAGIKEGDIVRGTTARSKNIKTDVTSEEGKDKQNFFGGMILFKADGETFDTVMAAIDSSKCANCDVILVLERPKS